MKKKQIGRDAIVALLIFAITLGVIQMTVLAAQNETINSFDMLTTEITVKAGTEIDDIDLPKTLWATTKADEKIEVSVTWDNNGLYNKDTLGLYTFTAQLDAAYTYAGELPVVEVTVVAAQGDLPEIGSRADETEDKELETKPNEESMAAEKPDTDPKATGDICQIIKGITYDESTGKFNGGNYIGSYSSIEVAVAALTGSGDEVIEMLSDYEMPESDHITLNAISGNVYFTTAPKTSHYAANREDGAMPGLYTGVTDIATIKRTSTDGSVLNIMENGLCTISHLVLDGNKANISTEAPLVSIALDGKLKLGVNAAVQNNFSSSTGGGINNAGTLTIDGGIVSANKARSGGGIYNTGTLEFIRGTVGDTGNSLGNEATQGGGVFNSGTVNMVNGAQIIGNKAVPNNNEDIQGGGICNLRGVVNIYGGVIGKNTSEGFGGGIYNHTIENFSDSETYAINLSGGEISENQSVKAGGGIFNTGVKGTTSGREYRASSTVKLSGTIKIINNQMGSTANNLHLQQDSYFYVIDTLQPVASVGVTGEGIDLLSTARGEKNGCIGRIWKNSNLGLSSDSLERIVNDEDGALVGTYGTASYAIVWGEPINTSEYVCKIGVKGYYTLIDALDDIEHNIDDSTTPSNSGAIPIDRAYTIEMLLEEYSQFGCYLPQNKNLVLTTAKSGTGQLDYKGVAGTHAVLKHKEGKLGNGSGNAMLYVVDKQETTGNTLTLENIIFDGQGGGTWTDDEGNMVTGEDNGSKLRHLVSMQSGELNLKNGAVFRNNKEAASVVLSGIDSENRVRASMDAGVIFEGNTTVDEAAGGSAAVIYLSRYATMNMGGGSIRYAHTIYDAAIGLNSTTEFIMSGGEIKENKMQMGAVVLNGGTFTMTGGTITDNINNDMGGGAFLVNRGTLNIAGGLITNNVAKLSEYADVVSGGAINMEGDGNINISGGEITNNISESYGGGISVKRGTINVSDNVKITDNYSGVNATIEAGSAKPGEGGVTDNVYLVNNKYLNVSGKLSAQASVGVTALGNDNESKNRMTQGARFGLNYDGTEETKISLKQIFRDSNGAASDGLKLIGKDGGVHEEGESETTHKVIWTSANNALTVSNIVVDAPDGFNEDFDYKIMLEVPTGNTLPTTIDCINSGNSGANSIALDTSGKGSFSLKPGANIVLQIPSNATYMIEQMEKSGYQTANAVNGGTQSNSLTTGKVSMDAADGNVVFTNIRLYTVTLNKTMTGDFIDSTRKFTFNVTISYEDGTTKTEKIILKKDDHVLLKSPLLKGTKVTVTEEAASGYSTSYVVNGDEINKTQGRTLTNLLIDGNKNVVCTNHSEIVTTGVETGGSNHLPVILAGVVLIILVAGGTALRLLKKGGRK
ncbi:MAG: DUF5979 domain-containing protein [Lachnospiraceae bacterium]